MKTKLFFLILFGSAIHAQAQDFLSMLKILSDTALIKNASVVMQEENIEMEISDIDRCIYKVHQVYTVLNEHGSGALEFSENTNKEKTLESAEIKVYDAFGKLTDKFKKKDMITQAYGDGLIDDGYITYFRVSAPKYPVTLEINYEVKDKGTVGLYPYVITDAGEAVVKSSFTVKVLKELDIRYKEKNIHLTPTVTEDGKYKIYQWSVTNMKALEYEEGASLRGRYPMIQIAPNKFSYYGNEGDLTSWKKYGEWINNLYKGLDELPAERKQFFLNLVKDAKTEKEKARIIYDYLQKNFRYVSIQLGVGGLKPFPASFTDQKKYGDCKGLSNYMKAALNAVGVKSYVGIINCYYNNEPVDIDFPYQGFNHVILCIPQPKDSIWLECTSNTTDFNVLGPFTENRYALLVTEEGGKLVSTPKSKPSDNFFFATTIVPIEPDGGGLPQLKLLLSGEYKDEVKNKFFDEKKDDQKDFLMNYYGLKHPDDFIVTKLDTINEYGASIKLAYSKIPEFVAGNKMFLAPRLYKLLRGKLPKAENRRLDFFFPNPFIKSDTTIYQLPDGYTIDALPAAKNISCDYGNFVTKYWFDAEKRIVYSTAKLELTQLRIPAARYAQVKTFFDEVMKEDSQRIVVKKQ